MKTYNVKCPICGHMNYDLYLEETKGWMVCEKCGQKTQKLGLVPTVKIPVYTMEGFTKMTMENLARRKAEAQNEVK